MEKNWSNITLKQAQEISSLGEMDELELVINQMAIIRDTTIDVIEALEPKELITFIEEYHFLKELPKEKKTTNFKYKGNRYGLIDFSKMTLAQMVDIEEYYNDGLMKNIHKILSVVFLPIKFYNPITKKYSLEPYSVDKDREEVFLELDMEMVWGTTLFFYHIEQEYMRGLNSYFQMIKVKQEKMMEEDKSPLKE